PELGYGEQGNEMILPNSLLVFDIELLGIDE
ncbi:MAG: FKBP-type peptidyl-prolyl cis-trans isomerase, partial [Spirochaetales bacterium]|nr:FKBP-type peptidyl-prolyl cis-trans isomerase [Spirochaetales bacterium]